MFFVISIVNVITIVIVIIIAIIIVIFIVIDIVSMKRKLITHIFIVHLSSVSHRPD